MTEYDFVVVQMTKTMHDQLDIDIEKALILCTEVQIKWSLPQFAYHVPNKCKSVLVTVLKEHSVIQA